MASPGQYPIEVRRQWTEHPVQITEEGLVCQKCGVEFPRIVLGLMHVCTYQQRLYLGTFSGATPCRGRRQMWTQP